MVVETTLKLFPAYEQFQLEGPDPTTVLFDYRGRNLRCCYCFAHKHLSSQCRQIKPSLFAAPQYKVDAVSTAKKGEGKPQSKGGAGTVPSSSGPRTLHHVGTGSGSGPGGNSTRAVPQEGESVAAKHKRNRPRNRTGGSGATLARPAGVSASEDVPGNSVPRTVEALVESPALLNPDISRFDSQDKIPQVGLSAEGWSPHPSGREGGKGLAAERGRSSPSTPRFSQTYSGRPGTDGDCAVGFGSPDLQRSKDLADRGHSGSIPHLDPGNIASTSGTLTMARIDNSPRKRLHSEFLSVPPCINLSSGLTGDWQRPPFRAFRTVDSNQSEEISLDCPPLPSHASLSPLLIQCAGSSIPASPC